VTTGPHNAGVKAIYNTGSSDIETYEFLITGINNLAIDEISIYPNPANDFINIKNARGSEIMILDLMGREQMYINCENDNQQVSISNLDSGIYLIRILNDGNTINWKLEVTE